MKVVQFPRHVRASTVSPERATERAASAVIISAVIPAWRTTAVPKTADHHSEGILSRRRHLETIERVAPMSDTAASMEGHRSITALNDAGFEAGLDIESLLGQFGLDGKANVAHDARPAVGDNAGMANGMSATEDRQAFIRRVRLARMARYETQTPVCTILGISQGVYKHYEGRSALPYRFIPKFVAATGIDYEWLLTGVGKGPAVANPPLEHPKRAKRGARAKAA